MTFQATVTFHFAAEDLGDARACVAQIIGGGIGTTSAIFCLVTIRREGRGERRAVRRQATAAGPIRPLAG